jgi:hypothetical protein
MTTSPDNHSGPDVLSMTDLPPVIDDFSAAAPNATNGARWEFIADGVMGGVSQGEARREDVSGRPALRLTGTVSLENNGGFLQVALNLRSDGMPVDASGFRGLEVDMLGNDKAYNLHLRTTDLTRPWQSYRQSFTAPPAWTAHRLPFDDFAPHRTSAPLDTAKLRRIGILAIGEAFDADIAIGGLRFY